ncbi:hypothetical protein EVG20_g8810 [Dentipellis fragilis]|uniref:Uncharacterized protein n=1 Tax=Dentipellis fragilis TaxID=205917 RepID=A0A4Y9Y4A3_9AGAM|nr:hypothetical protein EVG20_g8810 [Dentipellis fragilis]
MYNDRESFPSSFPSDPQESLLFAPHSDYSVDTQHLDNDQTGYGSLLEDLYVGGSTPLLDVGPGGTFDLDYSPSDYPTMHSPLYNDVPRINVNTTVTARTQTTARPTRHCCAPQ